MKVVIGATSLFSMSDEAVEECVRRGMKLITYKEYKEGPWPPDADFVADESAGVRWKTGKYSFLKSDKAQLEFRTNPILLKVVEELGDKAGGEYGLLKIVEIPFDTIEGWHICGPECGGGEYICEDHRTWD